MTHIPISSRRFGAELLSCQIIAGALVLGVLVFAGVAIALRWGKPADGVFISTVAVATAVVIAIARGVVLSVLDGQLGTGRGAQVTQTAEEVVRLARERGIPESEMETVREGVAERLDLSGKIMGRFQTRLIIGLAMIEGAAFFCIVAYLVEGQWWTLLMGGLLALWMLVCFPSAGKLTRWIDDREQLSELGSA